MKRIGLLLVLFLLPINAFAVTREEYNEAVASVSISAATTYQDDFVYSFYWGGSPSNPENKSYLLSEYMQKAFNGIKIKNGYIYGVRKDDAGIRGSFANKFPVYCATYVKEMVHHASSGTTKFNYGSNDSYEKVNVQQLKRGDIIDFSSHIAIFLSDAGDNNPETFYVAEASGKLHVRTISRNDIDTGWRIKDSVLNTLDENLINASYDFHDRLDDSKPVITSVTEIPNTNRIRIVATDFKHYELAERSDILEPESFGVVAYKVDNNNWITVNKTTTLDVETPVNDNGTHNIYVKDIGGNVTVKSVNLTNLYFDKELPTLGEFSFEGMKNSIKVSVIDATDNIGIKEYRYYLNDKLITSTKDNIYEIEDLSSNKEYDFYYEVVDTSNNVVKSKTYEIFTEIDARDIELNTTDVYIITNETYKLEPNVVIDSNNYRVRYTSLNEDIVKVSDNGLIEGISTGKTKVVVSVGRTKKEVNVTVSPYNIIFDLTDLPVAYINKEFEVEIKTNSSSNISIINSNLPNGLSLVNNKISGIPTGIPGEYEIILLASDGRAESIKKYDLYVKYDLNIMTNKLSNGNIGKYYNQEIECNFPAKLTIVNGALPEGLYLQNNSIEGKPIKDGTYEFTIKAEYMNSISETDFKIVIHKYTIYDYLMIIAIIALIIIIGYMIYKYLKDKKRNKKRR